VEACLYYNYKGFFSVVLLGLVDADYKFIWVDVSGMGLNADSQLFQESELQECLQDGTSGLPPADTLPFDDKNTPYFILADDAFELRTWLMKPFSLRHMSQEHRIFNYRLSRGRRIVENAFGIMSQRWQILLSTMQHSPENVRLIVEACVCLHNLMRMRCPAIQNVLLDTEDDNHSIVPGVWRQAGMMESLKKIKGQTRAGRIAKQQRAYLMHYFNSPVGTVSWQDKMI
jgi:hypothetical protein